MLDLDALASAEGEDWVWGGAAMLPGERSRALVSLSRGGGDARVLREYDLDDEAFVADGFVAPEAKQDAEWVDADTLILCSAHGEGMATRSGYARTARLWRRGEPFEAARIVFEGEAQDIAVFAGLDRSVEPPRWAFGRRTSFFAYDLRIGDLDGVHAGRGAGGCGQGRAWRLAAGAAPHALDARGRDLSRRRADRAAARRARRGCPPVRARQSGARCRATPGLATSWCSPSSTISRPGWRR